MNDDTQEIPEVSTENDEEEDFEALLNQSEIAPVHFTPGEKSAVVITSISKEWIFIDLGGKTEGYIESNEFLDDEGNMTVSVGDRIHAYFLSSRNNEKLFTTRLRAGAAGNQYLEEAYHNRIPLEGLVEKEIKGGFEVKLGGNTRAFCPFSQMGLQRVNNTEQYIGGHLTFHIIEYGEKGRNIIVSNRSILAEEQQKQKDALKETLREGMIVKGTITSIRDFGAFVDINGIEGLIPVSEIAWGRVEDVSQILSVGQEVDVAVMKLDWEKDRFSFSLKEIMPDPWTEASIKYPEGSSHQGTVSRLAPFGAFVTLEPGIDGLLHVSELGKGKKINHPREVLEEHQTLEVKVGKIDPDQKRISLKLVSSDQDASDTDYYKEHMAKNKNQSSGGFSTLGDLLKAKLDKK